MFPKRLFTGDIRSRKIFKNVHDTLKRDQTLFFYYETPSSDNHHCIEKVIFDILNKPLD